MARTQIYTPKYTEHFLIRLRDYVGLPYRLAGRDRNGVDCYGLVYLVLNEVFGIKVPSYDLKDVADRVKAGKAILDEIEEWTPVPQGQEQPGDVLLFRVGPQPWHMGIWISKGEMLHIQDTIFSVIEDPRGMKWAKRLVGVFRYERQ